MRQNILLTNGKQTGKETCFVGGKPIFPADMGIPQCSLCGAEQTFFFQIAFSEPLVWAGLTLAVFQCTSCANENHLIPEMLSGELLNADIPPDFLIKYQRNFRFEIFETTQGQMVENYKERIKFSPISLEENDPMLSIGHIGTSPNWILSDETPRIYHSKYPMRFLLQLDGGINFETVNGAPKQMEIGLTGNTEPSPFDFYQLFLGNTTYFFGTVGHNPNLVYAITQVT
ncbi:MAG: hypothetical protein JJU29_20480 [Verrucomicrobia bacterium]|nr:hypothetical protein [Verrucomicrobiota bacterium]MCH8510122.1 programmed cell death 2 domain-containing protein [Kiritimatiellia bacterium]